MSGEHTKPVEVRSEETEVAPAILTWARLRKNAERGEGVDAMDYIEGMNHHIEAQRRQLAILNRANERLRKALMHIAYEPFGPAELGDREVMELMTLCARTALEKTS